MTDMTSAQSIIAVNHECDDGWHRFTSVQVPGFYVVASRDELETVFHDIPVMLEMLISADEGRPVTIRPEQTYSQYVKDLPEEYLPIRHYSIEKMAA